MILEAEVAPESSSACFFQENILTFERLDTQIAPESSIAKSRCPYCSEGVSASTIQAHVRETHAELSRYTERSINTRDRSHKSRRPIVGGYNYNRQSQLLRGMGT